MAIPKNSYLKPHSFMIDDRLNYQARIRAAELQMSKSKLFRTAIRDYIQRTDETAKNATV